MKQPFAVFALLCAGITLALAAGLSPSPKAEIGSLLAALGTSQCEFYRNGSWYDSSKAQAHLNRKFEYLLKKGLINSAEEFISYAGTKSSMSGEPYRVRCPGQGSQPSAVWLGTQLAFIREKNPK